MSKDHKFTEEKMTLLRKSLCKDLSDQDFEVFVHVCETKGLDPFLRDIHPVIRKNYGKDVMTIQIGIDGFRIIAERTGKYAPGKQATFEVDKSGQLISATAYIKKMTPDGTWHEMTATAYWEEYAVYGKNGCLNAFWKSKPRTMLAKVAESHGLRRAFPDDLHGLYTKEEMQQADNPDIAPKNEEPKKVYITDEKYSQISKFLEGKDDLRIKLQKHCNVSDLRYITENQLEACNLLCKKAMAQPSKEVA